MTTTARLLLLLSTSLPLLPLAACAAQPAQSGAESGASAARAATAAAAAAAVPAAPVPAHTLPPSSTASASPPAIVPAPAAASSAQPRAGLPAPAAPAVIPAPPASANAAGDAAPALGATPVQETPATAAVTTPAATPATTTVPGTMPAPAQPMQAGAPAGSLWQTLLALVAVLAVLGALAWFLKRYGPKAGGGTANLRIVGSLNLGGRERLLVVEVGSQWIVVGASPGRVNALATMPRQDGDAAGGTQAGAHAAGAAALAPHGPAANSFADWLKQTIDKRK
jgi:flagellar biosynthetic protein FliO